MNTVLPRIAAASAVVMALCAFDGAAPTAAGIPLPYRGENLLQPLPLPKLDWKSSTGNRNGMDIIEWSAAGKNYFDTVIFRNDREFGVEQFKAIDVKAGKESCRTFSAETISSGPENGYPAVTWLSKCERSDGGRSVFLHKAIRGHDSFYHLQRLWREQATDPDIATWEKYMARVVICDTRADTGACHMPKQPADETAPASK